MTTTTLFLPRLTGSVQYSGVRFSVPPGFSFAEADPTASTSGYMLEIPDHQGKTDCSGDQSWESTSLFFTAARNIEDVSHSLHQTTIDGLSAEEDGASASGMGCQYVTQHVVVPNLGVGMAISGSGATPTSALALAREIIASATPTASTPSG
jgi:hypothetical protein